MEKTILADCIYGELMEALWNLEFYPKYQVPTPFEFSILIPLIEKKAKTEWDAILKSGLNYSKILVKRWTPRIIIPEMETVSRLRLLSLILSTYGYTETIPILIDFMEYDELNVQNHTRSFLRVITGTGPAYIEEEDFFVTKEDVGQFRKWWEENKDTFRLKRLVELIFDSPVYQEEYKSMKSETPFPLEVEDLRKHLLVG